MRILVCLAAGLLLASCTVSGAEPSPSGTPSPTAGPKQTVAVYYTLTTGEGFGPRLVREFHQVAGAAGTVVDQVRAAVTEMLSRNAFDPDYANLWPARTELSAVSVAGNTATVDIAGAASANLGAQASGIAVQQLIWTATAVAGIDEVRILLDGKAAPRLWGHVDISGALKRGSSVEVLAPVWLISPQHGEHTGREVTLHIAGIAYEATVNYEVRVGTQIVKEGFVTLSKGAPQQGEAKQTVTLEPGNYVIAAYLVSSEDAEREHLDDHSITVG